MHFKCAYKCLLFIGSEILSFARITSDVNTFMRPSNKLLKGTQKQGSKQIHNIQVEQNLWQTFECFKGFCRHRV